MIRRLKYIIALCVLFGCEQERTLFELTDSGQTGIDFRNELSHTPEFNTYTYRNFYNGGGVGIGDINNDGLADIFFCGNLVDNKLYLNKRGFQFEDITDLAGVASENIWSTGVSFADVNSDGWLDIYVCKSGRPGGEKRYNELFINNGDLTFTEQAKEYGLADEGLSSHAAFFDYDLDGDLDCYLLNNSFRPVGGYDMRPGLRDIRDTLGGNKLYRNDQAGADPDQIAGFTDVSDDAGIYGSAIGFGLGVTIGDVNRDGWPDIFVSNDFFERDYLYINQGDGTFKEDIENQMREISMGSMGADMADINNDGLPEIFVTEMLPRSEERYKTKMTFENWDKYQLAVRSGYHHQFTRNVLQLNNGNNTFSEIGRLANVHATDWSWSALIADLDNDGWKDIYVSNGIYKDLLDQDYIHYYSNEPQILEAIKNKEPDAILQLIDRIPSQAISNFAFRNNCDLTFDDYTQKWGLETPSFSNGSAYGDLDNDGDLDLVVNNVNMPAFVFRNNLNDQRASSNYLQIVLKGEGMNTHALGSQITAHHSGHIAYQELSPMRGFQSCTDYKITFGVGKSQIVDSLVVRWPDSRITRLTEVPPNQLLLLDQRDAIATKGSTGVSTTPLFHEITSTGLDYKHQESEFIDFDRDRLLFHMISAEGPRLCTGDINGNGLEDIFVGGAAGQAGAIFLQERDGSFTLLSDTTFGQDRAYEDLDATFFDADGDGDLDLFVCSGSNEFQAKSLLLADRLYLNDGGGRFERSHEAFDDMPYESSSCVVAADYDEDGDNDLFVGTRLLPGVYGVPVTSTLWKNNGQGKFSSVAVPALQQVGMVTDAGWLDIDQDQDLDLVIVGEWMPVTVLRNDDGMLTNATSVSGFARTNGLWNCIEVADLDNDGHSDLVLGNHGLNSRLKASSDKPMTLYVNDFDGNRTAEQLLCMYNGEESYPLALRHDLVMQLPGLKKDYLLYENYKLKTSQDLFSEREIGTAAKSDVYQLASCVAWNDGEGHFDIQSLPIEAQFSPAYAALVSDYDKDGRSDILLAGNLLRSKPEVGTYHASFGTILLGEEDRAFRALGGAASGLNLEGEVRDIERIQVNGKETILVARNNLPLIQLQVN